MLDFRKKTSLRESVLRGERRRIVLLLLMLGLVLIVAEKARDPALWRLLDRMVSPSPAILPENAVDNRLDDEEHQGGLAPDAFRLADKRPVPKGGSASSSDYFPGVLSEELEGIRDNRPSLPGEVACSMRLLDILHRTDSKTLRDASLGWVTYAQLFRQPDDYRGRLVTVSGTVRRAFWIEVASNSYGIKEYCQLWLWSTDNPTSPMIVYCLQLPKKFPTGMEINEQVELTGFFFKRCAYAAMDAARVAPEILAKTVQWTPRRDVAIPQPDEAWPLWLGIVAAVVVAAAVAWAIYQKTQAVRLDLPDRLPPFKDPNDGEE